ncbi:cupin domain-containing protein [Aquihabitans sp. McL0605]|uniref:cupin domain-containing protein n=1 Tax=Aquihabitans sp. McL0605 TaxID=3415671 RepID=UPI003CE733FD
MITCTNATDAELPTEPLDPSQVVEGAPVTGSIDLPAPPGLEVGIWEHSVGTSTDVEADEVFVVLSGRATIAADGAPPIEIGPGDVVTLAEGTATAWTVHEPLRKVYVSRA